MDGVNGEKNKNFELEKLRLIDISSEDDFLIDSQLCDSFEGFRLSVAFDRRDSFGTFPAWNRQKVVSSADIFGETKQETRQNGECNTRNSLAWDSAFFTSAGVLNPEELSMVNKGFKKTEMRRLPGIDEELQSSNESTCTTLKSNSLSFESLEIDLFKDMDESIFSATSRCAMGKESDARKKLEVTPRNLVGPVPGSARLLNTKGLDRISRERNPREVNSISQGSSSRLSGRPKLISATPIKRASFGNDNMLVSKKPCLGTPCSTKSYSSGSSTVTSDRSGNSSSDTNTSTWNYLRRKNVSGNNYHSARGKSLVRIINQLESSSRSTTKSMPKLSFPLSPDSPMMGHWSSESTSSCSIDNVKSKFTKANVDITPCNLRTSLAPKDISSHSRSSSHRLPSSKLGYFDGEKLSSLTTKSGSGLNNHCKLQAVRNVSSSADTSQYSKLKNASSSSENRRIHVSTDSGLTFNAKSEEQRTHRSLKTNRKSVAAQSNRQAKLKANNYGRSGKFYPEKKMNEDYLAYVSLGKENSFRYEDEVDDLSRDLGSVDFGADVVIEL